MSSPKVVNYLRLIADKAWQAWYKLPPQARAWNDIDDLIHDGAVFAQMLAPRHRSNRAQFSTLLTVALENYYKGRLSHHFTHKRFDCFNVPLASVQYRLTDTPQELEHEVNAVETLRKIFKDSSPVLRDYLERWLLLKINVHTRGTKFHQARTELRQLSVRYGFTRDDFSYLLYNDTWRHAKPMQRLRDEQN